MKKIFKSVFVIIGTIIGAGFASGQEIFMFFNKYGKLGMLGVIISNAIIGIVIYKVLKIVKENKINTYTEFLESISKNKLINSVILIIISLFLLSSFYIMIAGMSAYFYQEFKIPTLITSIIMAFICYLTLKKDIKGIVLVNSIFIPCLIIFIIFLGFKNINVLSYRFNNYDMISDSYFTWILSSILYASYNSIVLIPILIELKPYTNTDKRILIVSIFCMAILTILGMCIFTLLLRINNVELIELPMIVITKDFGEIYSKIYGFVIIIAIFTSAISAGYGFLKNGKKSKYNNKLAVMSLCAPLIANLGFSNLVSSIYPMFGILGLIQIIGIMKIKR